MSSVVHAEPRRQRAFRMNARWAVPMAPAVVLLTIFVLVPIGYALYLSFTNTRLTGVEAKNPQWIGLDNFRTLFALAGLPELPGLDVGVRGLLGR
jgi:multiple sugar transport system permease protein